MNAKLKDAWTSTQRAESLLFRAAAYSNLDRFRRLFDGFEIEGDARGCLIRMGCGLDYQNLVPENYLRRYPFSSIKAIRESLEQIVACDHAVQKEDGNYVLNARGEQAVRTWMERVSELMVAVDLGDIPERDVQKLLAYDHHILAAIRESSRPHGYPIFNQRLLGLHPVYDPSQLWHHWQLVWTMIAAREDEEEYHRQRRGLTPLLWFVRRQIWFNHRKPWLVRGESTPENLARRAMGYSPLERAEMACAQAIEELEARNWAEACNNEFRLTEAGLAACDQDEDEIDENFVSSWPDFSDGELDELLDITARLNDRFTVLGRQD